MRTVLSIITSPSYPAALDAFPAFATMQVDVGGVKFMSPLAMSLCGFPSSKRRSSQRIDLWRNNLEMMRIYTEAYSAEVVKLEAIHDLPVRHNISEDMSVYGALSKPEVTIAHCPTACPKPTVIAPFYVNHTPKTGDGVDWNVGDRFSFHVPIIARMGLNVKITGGC